MSREAGLPMAVPMIIMDWTFEWNHYKGKWQTLFPESIYGATNFDTHLYDFKDTVA